MNRITRALVGSAIALGFLAGIAPAAHAGGPVGGLGNWPGVTRPINR